MPRTSELSVPTSPGPSTTEPTAPEGCPRCGGAKECVRESGRLPVIVDAERPRATNDDAALDAQRALDAQPSGGRSAPLLSSGDLARACGTTVRTVRFYEEAGLVDPVSRSDGGHRLYATSQVARLQLIIDLREASLSLQDIKDLFELKRHATSSLEASERMTSMLHARIDDLQSKIAILRRLREELAQMVSMIRECGACTGTRFPGGCAGCDVMNRPDLPRAMRLLWG